MKKSGLIQNQVILFIFFVSLFSFAACKIANKTPLTEETQMYAGKWVANDGTYIHIYNNGGGDLKTGSSSVEGGKTIFKDGFIEIGLFGINKKYKIDTPPYEKDGRWYMVLDGFTYVKSNL